MFNNTKYTSTYFKIIEKAKSQERNKSNGYYELHHIHPKSLGGNDSSDNIVLLTAKEHFTVHHLLTKMTKTKNDNIKMIHAFWRMCHADQHKQKITARVFENLRVERNRLLSETMKGSGNPFYGKNHTQESINKMKKAAVGRNPHDNFNGKTFPAWNKGITKETSESLKRMAASRTGSGNPMSGKTGKDHPNTKTYRLVDNKGNEIKIFYSKIEFSDFCRENNIPFRWIFETSKNNSYYFDGSKSKKYSSFNGWFARIVS